MPNLWVNACVLESADETHPNSEHLGDFDIGASQAIFAHPDGKKEARPVTRKWAT